jgi:hypothetical protein
MMNEGRALDRVVAEKMMSQRIDDETTIPHYSTDLDTAWRVVAWLAEHDRAALSRFTDILWGTGYRFRPEAEAATMICRAALKARGMTEAWVLDD